MDETVIEDCCNFLIPSPVTVNWPNPPEKPHSDDPVYQALAHDAIARRLPVGARGIVTTTMNLSPSKWGFVKVCLLVGFLGQSAYLVVCSVLLLAMDNLGIKGKWTDAAFALEAPGFYLASLIRKPQAMEDVVVLSLSFVLNAIIFTSIWFAGSYIWRRSRSQSPN